MSVLIKDMEKPKYCYAVIDGESEYCPFVNTDYDCVILLKKGICEGTWEEQYSKCPLVEESERLTDDDFETIRIHLNAYKEKLCNQRRWEEAEEYQRIIDRLYNFSQGNDDSSQGLVKLDLNVEGVPTNAEELIKIFAHVPEGELATIRANVEQFFRTLEVKKDDRY